MSKKIAAVALSMTLALTACGGSAEPTPGASPTSALTAPSTGPLDGDTTEMPEGEEVGLPEWSASGPAVTFSCVDPDMPGVAFTVPFPADPSHEAIKQVEALRVELGVEEVPGYVVVEIDASQAGLDVERAALRGASWANSTYDTTEAISVGDLISTWTEDFDVNANGDVDLYNRGVEVSNALLNTEPNRGAKGFKLLATGGPIDSVVAPMLQSDWYTAIPCDLS